MFLTALEEIGIVKRFPTTAIVLMFTLFGKSICVRGIERGPEGDGVTFC